MTSTALRDAIADRESAELPVYLLTIQHPDLTGLFGQVEGVTLDGKMLLASGVTSNFVSRGQTFIAFGFEIDLPEQGRAQTPVLGLRVDNVDQRMTAVLRSLTSPATVLLEEVLFSSPDVVERAFVNLELVQSTGTRETIEARLSHRDYSDVPLVSKINSPATTPGIY